MRQAVRFVSQAVPYLIVVCALAFYAYIQVINFTPAYPEQDPDGYVVLAKRIAAGGPFDEPDDDMFLHQSHVWVSAKPGRTVPKFSPGYPALMAVAYLLHGDEGMFYVSPVLGGLALIGAFGLFRLWMSPFAAAIATTALAVHSMLLFYEGYLLTHAANLCFVTWGMFFLWRWKRNPRWIWALAAGLTLGFAATIRHTSALLAGVVAVAVVARLIADRKHLLRFLLSSGLLLSAYVVFPAMLAAYNWYVFGDPLATGYALSGEQATFTMKNYLANFDTVLRGMREGPIFPVFVLGLAGVLVAGGWSDKLMRIFWLIPLYVIYASYYWVTGASSYSRFFIATIPVLFGGGFLLMDLARVRQSAKYFGMVALVGVMAFGWRDGLKGAWAGGMFSRRQRELAAAVRLASENLDDDAVIFTRHLPTYHLGTRKNFRLYDLERFETNRAGAFRKWTETGTAEWHALNRWTRSKPRQQPERLERFRKFYESTTDEQLRKTKREMVASFLKQGRQVVLLVPERELRHHYGQLGGGFEVGAITEAMLFGRQWGLYEITRRHDDLLERDGPLRQAMAGLAVRVERGDGALPATVKVVLPNPYAEPLTGTLTWRIAKGSLWVAPAGPLEIAIQPGSKETFTLCVPTVGSPDERDKLSPLPSAVWDLRVGGRRLWNHRATPVTFDVWPYQTARRAMRGAVDLTRAGRLTVRNDGQPMPIRLKLVNPTQWPAKYSLTWRAPSGRGWKVEPASAVVELAPGKDASQAFTLTYRGKPANVLPLPALDSVIEVAGQVVMIVKGTPVAGARALLERGAWTAECVRTDQPPRIDGKLDDPIWADCPVIENFVSTDLQPTKFPTEVRMAYDRRNLYVAFRCREPKLAEMILLTRVRDGEAWADDSVELLLDLNYDKRSYFQYIFTAAGKVFDSAGRYNRKWDGPCTVRSGREAYAWTLEVAIPFKSLVFGPPEPGTKVGMDLGRNRRQTPRELSQWAPTFRGSHTPKRFGTLVFK